MEKWFLPEKLPKRTVHVLGQTPGWVLEHGAVLREHGGQPGVSQCCSCRQERRGRMAVFRKHGGLYVLSHSFSEPAIEEGIRLSWEQINLNLN